MTFLQPFDGTSVVIVTYRTGPTLFTAIAAVLGQTAPVELILVDNGNPPDVVARLQALAAADSRVRLLTGHGNIGYGRANNLGAAQARGRFLLILNPDCVMPPDTLAALTKRAAGLSEPFMIGARITNEDGSDQRGSRRELLTPATAFVEALHLGTLLPGYRLNRHRQAPGADFAPVPALSGAFMFLPKTSYDRIGGFDERYFLHVEDLDFCLRFGRAGGTIWFAAAIPVTHIGGTSEAPSDFIERHKARGFSQYFHANFGGAYPLLFLWCLDMAIWGRYLLRRCLNALGVNKRPVHTN